MPYELIVHDNGSSDNTEAWLKENKIKYSRSEVNEGVAAVNHAVKQAKYDFIVDANADMYFLPGWDLAVQKQRQMFKKQGIEKYTISACLIEPVGSNPEFSIRNHGTSCETFHEENLLQDFSLNATSLRQVDIIQYNHAIMMPKKLWEEFGGVDVNYKYGIATDHDIAAAAFAVGCRHFCRLGNCRIYHFVSQTIKKLPLDRPNNHDVFEKKWKMSVDDFRKQINLLEIFKI